MDVTAVQLIMASASRTLDKITASMIVVRGYWECYFGASGEDLSLHDLKMLLNPCFNFVEVGLIEFQRMDNAMEKLVALCLRGSERSPVARKAGTLIKKMKDVKQDVDENMEDA